MSWWVWILLGLAFMGLEVATGTFVLLFFGVAALAVGIAALFGLGSIWLQVPLFLALAVGAMLLFRRPLLSRLKVDDDPRDIDRLTGETAVASEDIAASGIGKVALRGSSWSARNAGPTALARGQRCTVERIEGLTLWVRPQ